MNKPAQETLPGVQTFKINEALREELKAHGGRSRPEFWRALGLDGIADAKERGKK